VSVHNPRPRRTTQLRAPPRISDLR